MKLVNPRQNIDIELRENTYYELVIENPRAMSNIIEALWKQCNGEDGLFVLSDKKKEWPMHKHVELVINPFQLDFNNKKIINELYSRLQYIANDFVSESTWINRNIIDALDQIIEAEQYSGIEYNLDWDWKNIFKLYSVRITDEYTDMAEKLMEYIKIQATLCRIQLIIFVGLRNYLSPQELEAVFKVAAYNKVHLLNIESAETEKIKEEVLHIIDKDFCLIVK